MPDAASVIVQTHWDREWYFTNEKYTARLVRIFPSVLKSLDNGQINNFLFDGQTSALEDLIANTEPDVAQKVAAFIKDGRINIGPWYVMPDEFLCAGESLVRNLEEGIRVSKRYGESSFLGYLPDTFGHIAQMPRIFRGFGIDTAVVWRGVRIDDDVFEWQSPDGTSVTCLFLPEGYYQQPFSRLDYDQAVTRYFDTLSARSGRTPYVLTQGGDHLVPPDNLKDRIQRYNASQEKYKLYLTTLRGHIAEYCSRHSSEKPVLEGELRDNTNAFVLPDVLSTRRYLKRENQELEDRLIGQIEPLLAAADLGDLYPHHYLRETWKLLLQQHAHDSICGCSIDEVHREMMVRFRRIRDRLDGLQTLVSEYLGLTTPYLNRTGNPSPFADDRYITAFNPSPVANHGWHPLDIFLEGREASALEVKDETGTKYDTVLCCSKQHRAFSSPVDDFPEHVSGHLYELYVRSHIKGWESKCLTVEKSGGRPPDELTGTPAANIQNRYYTLSVSDTGIQIEDRETGQMIQSAISIISEGDAGDTYNFSPPGAPWTAKAQIVDCKTNCMGEHGSELDVGLRIVQPASLDADRQGASENKVVSHGRLKLRLLTDESFMRARLNWTNNARDHRLRMVMPLVDKVSSSRSDSAFSLIDRPVVYSEGRQEISRAETRVSVNPSYSYIRAGHVKLAHRAVQEYEILDNGASDSIAFTLIRSVGWLSRRDLVTRGVGAGPDFETPEAQCPGEDNFEFLISMSSNIEHGVTFKQATRFRRPALFLNGHGRITDKEIRLGVGDLTVSSCRQVGPEIEIRLFNPEPESQSIDLGSVDARYVMMSGDECAHQTSNTVRPGEIITLRIKR
ncbi:MAG: glycoside hydrolase family 38 [Hyphomonadaceae bacterium]|nr:glycoside hydrolase family 38 [Hyphomonadaceae bacterium]MBC6412629.1 glycoside hydrolase family 38 [Hyphomonadaceae bacterium]